MSYLSSLFSEGWPMLAALALVLLITYGALRPHLGKTATRRDREKDKTDD